MFAALQGWLYRSILRPLLFRVDPDAIHISMVRFGSLLGHVAPARWAIRRLFSYGHPMLRHTVRGIAFPNPVGLAAGFDKNAQLAGILPAVGFGYAELGSVTLRPCEGNPPPRLRRLPLSKGILVHYGLRNKGVARLIGNVRGMRDRGMRLGISVARTNDGGCRDEAESIVDYRECLRALLAAGVGDYYTINISCPNVCDKAMFLRPDSLDRLLGALASLHPRAPLFVKMPVDLPWEEFHALLRVVVAHRCAGVVIANLTKDRENPLIREALPASAEGGISGKPLASLSDVLIAQTYETYGDRLAIIGVGGIFSAEDAYRKIRLGASLVQLITGMIYEGPQLIGQINAGLVRLLRRDGFSSVAEAVGTMHGKARAPLPPFSGNHITVSATLPSHRQAALTK
ncbi:MAG: quinone-dependent dihydroorotate dehydrogenase [Candidatus Peribacteraceae bacterium]|jgi:dihydroorotate dehydrogenase subfamily 2